MTISSCCELRDILDEPRCCVKVSLIPAAERGRPLSANICGVLLRDIGRPRANVIHHNPKQPTRRDVVIIVRGGGMRQSDLPSEEDHEVIVNVSSKH